MDSVEAWREALARGIAGDLCDRIVTERPVPARLLLALRSERKRYDVTRLSPRERETVTLAACGWENGHIAAALQISPITASTLIRNAMRRLGARNRTHMVALAIRRGLI